MGEVQGSFNLISIQWPKEEQSAYMVTRNSFDSSLLCNFELWMHFLAK